MRGFAIARLPVWSGRLLGDLLPFWVALALMALLGVELAQLTWRLAAPPPRELPAGPAVEAGGPRARDTGEVVHFARAIADAHLFGRAGEAEARAEPVKAPETRLNLTLHGVFVGERPDQGAAIIGKTGNQQQYHHTGEPVTPGVTLREVYPDRVIIMRNGSDEVLRFPKSAEVATLTPATVGGAGLGRDRSLRSFRELFQREPLKLFEYVRLVPVRNGASLRGYRLLPQRDASLYNQIGLRPTDLITAVNGISITDDAEAVKAIGELRSADRIRLQIDRDGRSQELAIDVK